MQKQTKQYNKKKQDSTRGTNYMQPRQCPPLGWGQGRLGLWLMPSSMGHGLSSMGHGFFHWGGLLTPIQSTCVMYEYPSLTRQVAMGIAAAGFHLCSVCAYVYMCMCVYTQSTCTCIYVQHKTIHACDCVYVQDSKHACMSINMSNTKASHCGT